IWLGSGGKTEPWVLKMPAWEPVALLQGKLAASDELDPVLRDLCQQTLVRNVHFNDNVKTGLLECWVEAVCVAPGFKDEADPENLRKVFHKVCNDKWVALKASSKFVFDIKATVQSGEVARVADSPVARLQNMSVK